MKKLILIATMVMVMLIGCGNKPEPVTEAEVVGYWMDEDDNLYKIAEGGMLYVYAPMILGDEVTGMMPYLMGTLTYSDGNVTLTIDGETGEITFSDDRNTMSAEHVTWKRISDAEAAELGVDVE